MGDLCRTGLSVVLGRRRRLPDGTSYGALSLLLKYWPHLVRLCCWVGAWEWERGEREREVSVSLEGPPHTAPPRLASPSPSTSPDHTSLFALLPLLP